MLSFGGVCEELLNLLLTHGVESVVARCEERAAVRVLDSREEVVAVDADVSRELAKPQI